MSIEITVPKLSATMEQATLLRWYKNPGDDVQVGDVLVELETDKAAMDVEATVSGKLVEYRASEGDVVGVGAVIAVMEGGAEVHAAVASSVPPPLRAPRLEDRSPPTGVSSAGAPTPMPSLEHPLSAPQRSVIATPLARRLAADLGLNPAEITGTGPLGRITRKDIDAAAQKRVAQSDGPLTSATAIPEPATLAADPTVPSRMRQAIAAQVIESRRTIPAFTLDRWVDLELLEDSRALLNRRLPPDARLTLTDLVVQALVDVLPKHPKLLSYWIEGDPPHVATIPGMNVGLVVALDDGLMIPILKDLDGNGLAVIARRRRDAIAAVRSGHMGAEFSGRASVSVSNIGASGADRFEAIISPGDSAILAIGRLHERPVAANGAVRVSRGAHFTLSVDHRVIDGATGAAFLGAVADRIERQTWRL